MAYKNNKMLFYAKNYVRWFFKRSYTPKYLQKQFKKIKQQYGAELDYRVNYYNKISQETELKEDVQSLAEFVLKGNLKTYFFDTYEFTRYFPKNYKLAYEFGDVTHIPEQPCLVKSRPIGDLNENAVLFKLNKVRHFNFIADPISLKDKKDLLVWRGNVQENQQHRISFFEKHADNSLCNIGYVNDITLSANWKKDKLTIPEQLKYKFILCLEGNDVASNLKWVMSSNSVAVMPKPKYETWFMEGTLEAGKHYIELKEDYSDLEEKLAFYSAHPQELNAIVRNANAHVLQYKDKERERAIAMLVLKKYFEFTN